MRLIVCCIGIIFLCSCSKIDGNDSVQNKLRFGKKCHHLYNGQIKLGIFEAWDLDTVQSSYTYSPVIKDKIFTDSVFITLSKLQAPNLYPNYASILAENQKQGVHKFELLKEKRNVVGGIEYVVMDYQMMFKSLPLAGTCMFVRKNDEMLSINCTGANVSKGTYADKREQFLSIMRSISWL